MPNNTIACIACGKNNVRDKIAGFPVCHKCGMEATLRGSKGLCVKCNRPLPPGSRGTTIHPACKDPKKPYIGYS